MTLRLLLDENLSPEIARQITAKRADIAVTSLYPWHNGLYTAQRDEIVLTEATREGLTLVTYNRKTILPVLSEWGHAGADHAGVIFIDDRSIGSHAFGKLVRALIVLWDMRHTDGWTNRVEFLTTRA